MDSKVCNTFYLIVVHSLFFQSIPFLVFYKRLIFIGLMNAKVS